MTIPWFNFFSKGQSLSTRDDTYSLVQGLLWHKSLIWTQLLGRDQRKFNFQKGITCKMHGVVTVIPFWKLNCGCLHLRPSTTSSATANWASHSAAGESYLHTLAEDPLPWNINQSEWLFALLLSTWRAHALSHRSTYDPIACLHFLLGRRDSRRPMANCHYSSD